MRLTGRTHACVGTRLDCAVLFASRELSTSWRVALTTGACGDAFASITAASIVPPAHGERGKEK